MKFPKVLTDRALAVWLVPIMVVFFLIVTDPDPGDLATTKLFLLRIASAFIVVALAHWLLKSLFDYPESDRRTLFEQVRHTEGGKSMGAAGALIAQAITFVGLMFILAGFAHAQDVRTFIPANCANAVSVVRSEQARLWPDHPNPATLMSLAEQESCVTLRSIRCCDTSARLKNAREEGAGPTQITRAFRADGSLRFDALAELKARHPALAEWSWENVYQRPDLAWRAHVLKSQDNYKFFHQLGLPQAASLDFADGAHNAGSGRMQNDRRACAMTRGCDPSRWFGNVELHCTASRVPIYGQRSACDINREHVRMVRVVRLPKYGRYFT